MHWKDNVWGVGWMRKRSDILLDEHEDWGGEPPKSSYNKKKKIRQARIEDFY